MTMISEILTSACASVDALCMVNDDGDYSVDVDEPNNRDYFESEDDSSYANTNDDESDRPRKHYYWNTKDEGERSEQITGVKRKRTPRFRLAEGLVQAAESFDHAIDAVINQVNGLLPPTSITTKFQQAASRQEVRFEKRESYDYDELQTGQPLRRHQPLSGDRLTSHRSVAHAQSDLNYNSWGNFKEPLTQQPMSSETPPVIFDMSSPSVARCRGKPRWFERIRLQRSKRSLQDELEGLHPASTDSSVSTAVDEQRNQKTHGLGEDLSILSSRYIRGEESTLNHGKGNVHVIRMYRIPTDYLSEFFRA